jgi:hypothetical protein
MDVSITAIDLRPGECSGVLRGQPFLAAQNFVNHGHVQAIF